MVRFKVRYLVFEAVHDVHRYGALSKDDIFSAIKHSIQENFGDFGHGTLFPTLQGAYRARISPHLSVKEHQNSRIELYSPSP